MKFTSKGKDLLDCNNLKFNLQEHKCICKFIESSNCKMWSDCVFHISEDICLDWKSCKNRSQLGCMDKE
jgi:hypothetical protein